MNRNSIPPIVAAAAVILSMACAPVAAKEKLDPYAIIEVRDPLKAKTTGDDPHAPKAMHVQEGTLLQILCTDVIEVVDYWTTHWVAHPGIAHYQTLVRVDGTIVEIYAHDLASPKQLMLGTDHLGGNHAQWHHVNHPAVYWIAEGVGQHELNCVTNWQMTLPDNNPANNAALARITVTAAKGTAQPPAKLPPADQGLLPLATEVQDARQARPTRHVSPEPRPSRSGSEPAPSRRQPEATATRGAVSPVVTSPQDAAARAMTDAGCVLAQARVPGHYACPTQAALARCQRLLAAKQVLGCTLSE